MVPPVVAAGPARADAAGAAAQARPRHGRVAGPVPAPAVAVPKRKGDIEWVFKSTFGKTKYKGMQREVMEAALDGKDVLVIAPTGMGKVPAVVEHHGMTIVVSPLLSLMRDQIRSLKDLGVRAVMLSSTSTMEEQKTILRDMESGHPQNRLLYITPERLASARFKKCLEILEQHKELKRLVIDEAHCISEWGHTFRPDYAKIGEFRTIFPRVPIMALTASATADVQRDIVKQLEMAGDNLHEAIHDFNRPNLFYEIRYYSDSTMPHAARCKDVLNFIQKITVRPPVDKKVAGIIYCRRKDTCTELAQYLRQYGVMASPFHRGLSDTVNNMNQLAWVDGDSFGSDGTLVRCIVATVAFGMGIDKADCSYVVHFDTPSTFEGYYQETGRAGRNGHPARCLMYYSVEDETRISSLVQRSHNRSKDKKQAAHGGGSATKWNPMTSLMALIAFARNARVCRHVEICRYFGDDYTPEDAASLCSKMCDVCKHPVRTRSERQEGLHSLDFAQTQAVVSQMEPDDFFQEEEEGNSVNYYPDATNRQGAARVVEEVESDQEEGNDQTGGKDDDFITAGQLMNQVARVQGDEYGPAMANQQHCQSEEGVVLGNADHEEEEDAPVAKKRRQASSVPSPPPRPSPLDSSPARAHNLLQELGQEENGGDYEEQRVETQHSGVLAQDRSDERKERKGADLEEDQEMEVEEQEHEEPEVNQEMASEEEQELQHQDASDQAGESDAEVDQLASTPEEQVAPPPRQKQNASGGKSAAKPVKPARKAAPVVKPVEKRVFSGVPKYVEDPITTTFKVRPPDNSKGIELHVRRKAVVSLERHLARALLSKHGNRSSESEEQVWKALGGKRAKHEKRRLVLLNTAIELESDLFWSCTTTSGHAQFLVPILDAVDKLVSYEDPLPETGDSAAVDAILEALHRVLAPKQSLTVKKVAAVELEE